MASQIEQASSESPLINRVLCNRPSSFPASGDFLLARSLSREKVRSYGSFAFLNPLLYRIVRVAVCDVGSF
jgi:hypothetical protein